MVINANNGAVLKTIADLGGADEVWFNPGDGHYVIPSCNTACRTVGGAGPELLGIVDLRRTPDGPHGHCCTSKL